LKKNDYLCAMKTIRLLLSLAAMLLSAGITTSAQVKTVAILGDSYSTFEGCLTPDTNAVWYWKKTEPKRTDVSRVEQTWWHLLIAKHGWQLGQNNSFSGSTVCHRGYRGEDYSDRSFVTRMDNLGTAPDIIFIFGATNDSWAHAPVGHYQWDNFTKADLYAFRPAMAHMLGWMKEHYASSSLYFILNHGLTDSVTTSAQTICEHYGVKCIRLNGIDKISGHPSVKGMQQIAEQVDRALTPTVTWDRQSLLIDGRRVCPVMGEVHYSRIPADEWADEVRKMREGGVTMLATYVFWNHIEEQEGRFRWDGQRSLRRFLEVCRQQQMPVVLRLGPFCHGEVRNGGIPDWLFEKGCKLRSTDPAFLGYAEKLYRQIFTQVQGLQWKDGGPVIAAQFDNEYRGSGDYLMALKRIALAIGFDLPFYTRTGWPALSKPVPFGEMLPLYGDYADGFWDKDTAEGVGEYYKAFNFKGLRSSTAIGTDLLGKQEAKAEKGDQDYPYFTCELGGGMVTAYHRRPYIYADDCYSMAVVKLGSGSNLLGYYMYHGGSNPEGELHTLNEVQTSPGTANNDLPVVTYDFQAPLGEFGQTNESFYRLRPLHLFMNDYAELLAPMNASFPAPQDLKKGQDTGLRWSYRSLDQSGFIFVNNYERLQNLSEKRGVQLSACGVSLPKLTIPAGCIAIFPVNIDGIKYSTAQIVAKRDGKIYLMQVKGIPTTIALQNGKTLKNVKPKGTEKPVCENIYLLTQETAEHLFLPANAPDDAGLTVRCQKVRDAGALRTIVKGKAKVAEAPSEGDWEQAAVYKITVPQGAITQSKHLLRIDYQGDCARLYVKGQLIADHFQYGRPFLYGLWRLPKDCAEIELRILPWQADAPVYLPREADKTAGERVKKIEITSR